MRTSPQASPETNPGTNTVASGTANPGTGPEADGRADEAPALAPAVRHVLLIEDDRRITTALHIRLNATGHRVSHAGDLDEAVERIVEERPDVAVLDINLPDGNGLDLAERMRRLRITARMPLILITASRDPDYRERAVELEIPLIEKPFPAADLLDAIERAVTVR